MISFGWRIIAGACFKPRLLFLGPITLNYAYIAAMPQIIKEIITP